MTAEPITLYSKPGCVQCNMTARALDKQGLDYDVVDVTKDADALDHIKNDLGHLSAPVVEAGGQNWSGYRPDRVKGLAGEAKETPSATAEHVRALASVGAPAARSTPEPEEPAPVTQAGMGTEM